MKKLLWLWYSILCFLVLSRSYSAGAQTKDLFADSTHTMQAELKPVNPAIVIRQRLVTVRLELLSEGNENADFFHLNLFDDAHPAIIRDHMERYASGSFAWMGYTPEIKGGKVTLVVEGSKLSATIILPEVSYHVRYLENGLHVVREIDSGAFPISPSYSFSESLLARTGATRHTRRVRVVRGSAHHEPGCRGHRRRVGHGPRGGDSPDLARAPGRAARPRR